MQVPEFRRLLVIAAHPDDETVGATVPIARATEVRIVHVTDGAPNEPKFRPPQLSREEYAATRRSEAVQALSELGVGSEEIVMLGFRDLDASNHLYDLTLRVAEAIEAYRPSVLLAHAYEGGHPDHDAIAFATANAERVLRARESEIPLHLEMALYHGFPAFTVGRFLPGGGDEHTFALDEGELRRKRSMMQSYASQQHVLADFYALTEERIRVALEYDFTRPPHDGTLQYERWEMPMTGERWRALARDALRALA
jgi:LmbE family N-acetylglucosaminyl deacetylase